jgi:MerR family transcriptional regulator, light-induced transcriptional regulator
MVDFLSPKDFADAIGVSESSVKRWADEGLLAVSRTGGGHRRIALREAVRYIRHAGLPVLKPQILGLADVSAVPQTSADIDQTLMAALLEGRAEAVRGLVVSLYLAGRSVADLCDGPLTTAMRSVGELWRHGPRGIFIEHRAVDLCLQALNQLRSLFPVPAPDAPLALGGALAGDHYMLPTLMVACTLGSLGWPTVNLGPNLPLAALQEAIQSHQPTLVWLSCSVDDAARDQERELRKVGKALTQQGIKALVGGRAWKAVCPAGWEADSGLHAVSSMAEVAAFAEGLR